MITRLRSRFFGWPAAGLLPAGVRIPLLLLLLLLLPAGSAPTLAADAVAVKSVFERFCFDCHGQGAEEGGVALDQLLAAQDPAEHHAHWLAAWKNLRAQTMPPADEAQPAEAERELLLRWIEREVFRLDPERPDPGQVTVRRLNRQEYRHTIQDLLGIEFDTTDAFPADDTGYGFDTIGDVLSLSPLHVEKYLTAARSIVGQVVGQGPTIPTQTIEGYALRNTEGRRSSRGLPLTQPAELAGRARIEHPGEYRIALDVRVFGSDEATANTADLVLRHDGREVIRRDLGWDFNSSVMVEARAELDAGEHELLLKVEPKDPPGEEEKPLYVAIRKVELTGPLDGSVKVYPPSYRRVFLEGPPPDAPEERQAYARRILERFASRAFRRPVDPELLDRLVKIALTKSRQPNGTFEQGIAQAMTAVLISPSFLFRAESQPRADDANPIMPLDEFALASRLSYFLWSSLPDEELYTLARQGQLREQLDTQLERMLADEKIERFVDHFVGQWLQLRDVESMNVDVRRILRIRDSEEANRIFHRNLRRAMRQETELLFLHLLRENGSLLDLLTANYSYLNESLADWYGIEGVQGNEMRRVELPPGSHRGGLLTHASFLLVTSNPTRTSPVKRGLFVLENLLGTPAPPPPADVPPLEDVRRRGDRLSMREMMELHRADALCASCHARMDPLGLAMEEYTALGSWRATDGDQPIDTAGQLITGEKFADTRELAEVIATRRTQDYYRCVTEKLLTYALGRGVEYYDAPTVDRIVAALQADGGRMRTLLSGIVRSVPFQQRRGD